MSSYQEITDSISVSVHPVPMEEECRPSENVYVFAYTVTIQNHSPDTVQLLERHWIIESAGEQIGEVTGPGVVGVQPVLKSGETFEYTSSTVIRDPIGSMYGTYIFTRESGGAFVAQIPKFNLVYPTMYH